MCINITYNNYVGKRRCKNDYRRNNESKMYCIPERPIPILKIHANLCCIYVTGSDC